MKTTQDFEGVFSLGKNGIAYITNKKTGQVIEVPSHNAHTALHKDIVKVKILNLQSLEGEVTEIKQRANTGFVGLLKKENNLYKVKPDNYKIPDIEIEMGTDINHMLGHKVFVNITGYVPHLKGTLEHDLGDPFSNEAMMRGIALEGGFDYAFPKQVEQEAHDIEKIGISSEEIKNRRDMRETLTFTIDPQDAKDFDDALSLKLLDNHNYEIGIHIADVSHYVRPGTALDKEAQKRTTSVYLVDRTIPMLPEALSNGLCSIRPNEDKLAFSVVFEINPKNGDIIHEWFGKTLIRSDKRFSYEEAQNILDTGKGLYIDELTTLKQLADIYEQKRYNEGALDFETREVKFILDEHGVPLRVKIKERIDTNKLIEEFMLLANRKVAEFMQKAPFFIYRIHDKPEPERVEILKEFLHLLGYHPALHDGIIPKKELQKIIKEAEGTPIYDTLQTVIVRSMQKAIYTTQNIGHFGLSFKYYTHFTSPIRRYPDVIAHRLLEVVLKESPTPHTQEWVEDLCAHSSLQEQKAVTAERNSIKLKQVEYMSTKDPEQIFDGIVTGAGKFGVFVAEAESLSEGMIRLFDLGDDLWEYKEKSGIVIGKKTKKVFKIGDLIKIKIKQIDIPKKLIDYELVINGKPQGRKNNGQRSSFRKTKN